MKEMLLDEAMDTVKKYFCCMRNDKTQCLGQRCLDCRFYSDINKVEEALQVVLHSYYDGIFEQQKNEFEEMLEQVEIERNKNNEKAINQQIVDIETKNKLKSFSADLRIEFHHADLCREKLELVLDLLNKIEEKYNM